MTPEDFERLQALLAARAGYRLTRDRMQLAEHRLGPLARREGYHNVEAMLAGLWSRPVASLGWAVIETLLNAETWFRRDRSAFDVFARELLPALSEARSGRSVRVLSAGSGTGQEAYSLAMAALDLGLEIDILALDLSQRALEKGRSGLYTSFEIQRGLSARMMLRWFEQAEDQWRARPELRRAVRFERGNLLDLAQVEDGFDVVFCRYVLRDMSPDYHGRVLEGLERRMADDGCLFLGLDERTDRETLAFRPVAGRKGLYVKSASPLRRAA